MNCSIAFQYLPMNAGSDDEVCRIVAEVIAVIDASGLDYYVGPFETAVEGDLDSCMALVKRCLEAGIVLPAYECALKCSHLFNLLDARGAVSVTERVGLMKRVRDLAIGCAEGYLASRERLGFPLLQKPAAAGGEVAHD